MATRWCGVDPNLPPQRQEKAEQLLTYCLNLGISAIHSSASTVDVVELVICLAILSCIIK
jgi:beta-aspartyl-peptidase (threonine type)